MGRRTTAAQLDDRETVRPPPAMSGTLRKAAPLPLPAQLLDRRETTALPSPDAIPVMTVGWDDVSLHALTRDEIFLLTMVDGIIDVGTLLDVSAAPPMHFTVALRRLMAMGLLTFADAKRT